MIRKVFFPFCALCCGAVLLLSGCLGGSTDPTRYYVLSEIEPSAEMTSPDLFAPEAGLLLVGPVTGPRYLDRPQIVTRTSANELVFGEYDRWAEPLDESFDRILASNLSQLLPTKSILPYPSPGAESQNVYQLIVEVTRFDGVLGGDAVLVASWNLVDEENRSVLPLDRATYREATGGSEYIDLVKALNRTMEQLCSDIAEKIRAAVEEKRRKKGA